VISSVNTPTDPRESSGPKTNGHTVSRHYLLNKKLNEKRKKNSPKYRSQHVVLPDDCQTALPAYSARSDLLCVVSPVFLASSFLTATAECLCYSPKGQNKKGRALFTLERLICCPRQIIPPTTDDVCVFDWLKRGQKQGELCTLSGHDC